MPVYVPVLLYPDVSPLIRESQKCCTYGLPSYLHSQVFPETELVCNPDFHLHNFTCPTSLVTMRLTPFLCQAKKGRSIKSLALSVYFKQADFGMKDYEILSRASAFLLAVDPPEPLADDGPYGHLQANERKRKYKMHLQDHEYTPVGGPEDRELKDLGWLEFAPREVRPTVHCVCSSHVLAPFLWKDYYPQEWLSKVKQEHW